MMLAFECAVYQTRAGRGANLQRQLIMEKGNIISTREKLGALIKRFLKFMDDQKNTIFEINTLANQGTKIFKDPRKSLDIIFYFEALGLILRVSSEHLIYVGFRGLVRKLQEFESNPALEGEVTYEEATVYGKLTSLRPQILSGQLLARIFYNLIYQKEAVPKSSIEDMVEGFMYQQKDLNLKNFIPQILNILGIIGLIEKNEATEVITYIGPDLKCYDENQKKITWKMFELTKREEQAIGKDGSEALDLPPKPEKTPLGGPVPVHMSYFPELSYAALRSSTWEKNISSTVFFIGRNQKRSSITDKCKSYKVDLQLPYRSVSRQHALIIYNFEQQRWEIRCLSKKNLIKVDGQRFAYGDKNIWLRNKSQVQIGPEKMVFLEANNFNE